MIENYGLPALLIILVKVSTGSVLMAGGVNRLFRTQAASIRHFVWLLALLAPLCALPLILSHQVIQLAILPPVKMVEIKSKEPETFPKPTIPPITNRNLHRSRDAFSSTRELVPAHPIPSPSFAEIFPVFNSWIIGWLSGSLLFLSFLIFSHWRLHSLIKLRSSSTPQRWLDHLNYLQQTLALERRLNLLVSTHTSIPFCLGLIRPTIVLPVVAKGWSREKIDHIFRHELAHIQRGDLASIWLAQLGCAICWFNPLMWLALNQLRNEGELMADHLVLTKDISPEVYAAHLVDIAESSQTPSLSSGLVLPMARTNRLKSRVLAILDSTKRPGVPGFMTFVGLTISGLFFLVSVVCIHLSAQESFPKPTRTVLLPYPSNHLNLQIVDRQGQPLPGAKVEPDNIFTQNTSEFWIDPENGQGNFPHPIYTTNEEGKVTVPYVQFLDGNNQKYPVRSVSFNISREDYGQTSATVTVDQAIDPIVLLQGTRLTVHALGENGQILSNVYVESSGSTGTNNVIWTHSRDRTSVTSLPFPSGKFWIRAVTVGGDGSLSFSEVTPFTSGPEVHQKFMTLTVKPGHDLRGMIGPSVPRPIKHSLITIYLRPHHKPENDQEPEQPNWAFHTTVEGDGSFILRDLPPGGDLYLTAICDGYLSARHHANPSGRIPPQIFPNDPTQIFTVEMEKTGTARIQLLTSDGRPLVNKTVFTNPNVALNYSTSTIVGGTLDSLDELYWLSDDKNLIQPTDDGSWLDYRPKTDVEGIATFHDLPAGLTKFAYSDDQHYCSQEFLPIEPDHELAGILKEDKKNRKLVASRAEQN